MHTEEQIPTAEVYDSSFGAFEAADREVTWADTHRTLMVDLIQAITQDPARKIPTPGFNDRQTPAADVVADMLDWRSGDSYTHDLMKILGRCASGKLDQQTHLMASALLAVLAKRHADFHVDEAAE